MERDRRIQPADGDASSVFAGVAVGGVIGCVPASAGATGVAHLFIGIVFFGIYGTEPIQKYFAMPLFVLCGFLFLYEGIWHKSGVLDRPTRAQWVLLALYVLYPLISALLGNRFPTLVTHIMPCPVAYLGLVVYAGCRRKNVVLLGLLTLWGLTGVKSVIFQAYEDVILLLGGLYGLALLRRELVAGKHTGTRSTKAFMN